MTAVTLRRWQGGGFDREFWPNFPWIADGLICPPEIRAGL